MADTSKCRLTSQYTAFKAAGTIDESEEDFTARAEAEAKKIYSDPCFEDIICVAAFITGAKWGYEEARREIEQSNVVNKPWENLPVSDGLCAQCGVHAQDHFRLDHHWYAKGCQTDVRGTHVWSQSSDGGDEPCRFCGKRNFKFFPEDWECNDVPGSAEQPASAAATNSRGAESDASTSTSLDFSATDLRLTAKAITHDTAKHVINRCADKIEQLNAEVLRLGSEVRKYQVGIENTKAIWGFIPEMSEDVQNRVAGLLSDLDDEIRHAEISAHAMNDQRCRTITSKELEAAAHELRFQMAWNELPNGYKSDLKLKASAIFKAAGFTIDESEE